MQQWGKTADNSKPYHEDSIINNIDERDGKYVTQRVKSSVLATKSAADVST